MPIWGSGARNAAALCGWAIAWPPRHLSRFSQSSAPAIIALVLLPEEIGFCMNRAYRFRLFAAAVFGLLVTVDSAKAAAPPKVQNQVQTAQGAVEGLQVKGISEFLGIPYAAPPVGDLRWRPPLAAQPWTGVRRATKFGPSCAQVTTLGAFAGPANDNEDCLTLNVFTPETQAAAKLPVIVWIHGGGNLDGES